MTALEEKISSARKTDCLVQGSGFGVRWWGVEVWEDFGFRI